MKDRVVGNTDRKGNQHTSIDDNPFPPSLLGLVNERVEKYPDPTRASLGTHAEPSPPFSFARFHTALAVYPPDLVPSRKRVVGCHAGAHARRSIKKKRKRVRVSGVFYPYRSAWLVPLTWQPCTVTEGYRLTLYDRFYSPVVCKRKVSQLIARKSLARVCRMHSCPRAVTKAASS